MKYEVHADWPEDTFRTFKHMKNTTHTIEKCDTVEEAEVLKKILLKNGFQFGPTINIMPLNVEIISVNGIETFTDNEILTEMARRNLFETFDGNL